MLKSQTIIPILRQNLSGAGLVSAQTGRLAVQRTPLRPTLKLQHRPYSSPRLLLASRPSSLSVWRSTLVRRIRNTRQNSNKPPQPAEQEHGSQALSVSGRFRELSRKYGWAAVGVYLGLSVIDFPFCFLAVRLVGPDRIGEVEHAIVDGFWHLVGVFLPSMKPENQGVLAAGRDAEDRETNAVKLDSHKGNGNASLWTQLLLAYGVHKSLIFFRVPLTAAVTPKVVKTLRKWGWKIGRPGARAAKQSQLPK